MPANEKLVLELSARQCIDKDSRGKKDVCPVYIKTEVISMIVDSFAKIYEGKVDFVAAPESLGFILGSMLADRLGTGFIPIRNVERAPLDDTDAIKASYIDHRNQVKSLQVRKSVFPKDARILLADNWVETAATMQACMTIIEEAEAKVVGIASIGADLNDATRSMIESAFLTPAIIEK